MPTMERQPTMATKEDIETAIREPSDAEMKAARNALAQWQTPNEFLKKVSSFAPLIKSSTLFNKNSAGFLLDAIPIAEFSKHRAIEELRLAEQREQSNDGQFRIAGKATNIEVTEVMEPGRKRGDEYRSGPDVPEEKARDFDPNLGKTIAKALSEGIKKKAEKKYATKPLLLVYLNISTGGRLADEVEREISNLKVKYVNEFTEICVLWAGKLH
jgi:hypothetical protein